MTATRVIDDHTELDNVGSNTHSEIDANIINVEANKAEKGANADITSTSALIQITRNTGGTFDVATGSSAGDDFTINTNRVVIEGDSGYVGVGTTTPVSKVHITDGILTINDALDFNPVIVPIGLSANLLTMAGNVDAGLHYYAVVYYTADGNTETSCASDVPITTDITHAQVDLTVPVSTDSRVVGRRLYRTPADSPSWNDMTLLTEIADNTTTEYRDNKADSELTGDNVFNLPNTTSKFISINNTQSMFIDKKNVALGYQAGKGILDNELSSQNVVMGSGAGKNLTSGSSNVFLGYSAGMYTTTGASNLYAGWRAGNKGTTAGYNVMLGRDAGLQNTTGSNNVVLGRQAMEGVSGYANNNNVVIGLYAGRFMKNSEYNTIVGYQAGYTLDDGDRNIIIGNQAEVPLPTGNYQLSIGNVIYGNLSTGNIGIGTSSAAGELCVNGGVTVGSDVDAGDNNLRVEGTGYFVGALTAASYADNTPGYDGDALTELKGVKTIDGEIDHKSLPAFAQINVGQVTRERSIGKKVIIDEKDAFEDKITTEIVEIKDNNDNAIVEKVETAYKIEDGKSTLIDIPTYKTEKTQTTEKILKEGIKFDSKTGKFFIQEDVVTEIQEEKIGRDIGAMVSIMTKAIQQLTIKVENLEKQIQIGETKI